MMIENHIVLGLNFGDEGKGARVNELATPGSVVIRFSGGHQAGHTVELPDGRRHVFSHFGAASFKDIPTFWSKYCTFYPTGMLREREKLVDLGVTPVLMVDPLAPVTTPYDVLFNQNRERSRSVRHGSVGVGVGHTFERNETTPLRLYTKDLLSPSIFKEKLAEIEKYYIDKSVKLGFDLFLSADGTSAKPSVVRKVFCDAVEYSLETIQIRRSHAALDGFAKRIYEGSQGILLDQDHGVCFPHVTRANTTSKNAIAIIDETVDNFTPLTVTTHYMTRCYLTRHGRGPLENEMCKSDMLGYFDNLSDETNVPNPWQETLRYAYLNVEYFQHSLISDEVECNWKYFMPRQVLCITCIDQLKSEERIPYYEKGSKDIKTATLNELPFVLTEGYMDENRNHGNMPTGACFDNVVVCRKAAATV